MPGQWQAPSVTATVLADAEQKDQRPMGLQERLGLCLTTKHPSWDASHRAWSRRQCGKSEKDRRRVAGLSWQDLPSSKGTEESQRHQEFLTLG